MPATAAQMAEITSAQGDIDAHKLDLANPHVVTLTQAAAAGGTIAINSDTTGTLTTGRGGTGLTVLNNDAVVVSDGFGQFTAGKTPTPTGDFLGTSDTQNVSNKTFTDEIVTTDGRIDSSLATAAPSIVIDQINGGHSGALFEVRDSGTERLKLNAQMNLIMSPTAWGVQQGGFYSGGNTEATWAGATKPHNAFQKLYSAQANNIQYSTLYVEAQTKNTVTTPSTDTIGILAFSKMVAGGFGNLSHRSTIGGQFTGQGASYGATTQTMSSIEGGRFIASFSGAATENVSSVRAGYFLASIDGGTNAVVTELTYVDLIAPGNKGAGSSVTNYYGIRIPDLNQDNYQATVCDAIKIADQTPDGASALDGNINFYGGDWDAGHLQLNTTHVWEDHTNTLFRFMNSAPAATTNGVGLGDAGETGAQTPTLSANLPAAAAATASATWWPVWIGATKGWVPVWQ